MIVLYRIMMMAVGYILACVAASLVLTIGMLTPEWEDLASLGVQSAAMWSVVGVGAAVIVAVAFLPALLVIALTEGLALRSVIIYGVVGGALALALSYGLDFSGFVTTSDTTPAHDRQVLAAAGIAGGLVYWLFAGRNAGLRK